MSMVVRTNSMAMSANSALNKNNSTVAGNLQKLSTGFRINRAADDASGLAVSEKMKAQIKALDQASKNAQDGASLIKTAEGYMGEIHDMLNRIVELAEKSANGTFETTTDKVENYGAGNAATDRQAIQDEVDQLTTEIDRIATTANFNQLKLLDGSLDASSTTATNNTQQQQATATTYYSRTETENWDTTKFANDAAFATAQGANESVTVYDASGAKHTVAVTVTPGENSDPDTYAYTVDGEAAASGFNITDYSATAKYTYNELSDAQAKAASETNPPTQLYKAGSTEGTYETTTYTATTNDNNNTTAGTGKALKLQIGETSNATDKLEVSIMNFQTSSLLNDLKTTQVGEGTDAIDIVVKNDSDAAKTAGIDGLTFNVSNQDAASVVAEKVRDVINKVSAQRATLGAMENRLDYTMNNLDTASQNITDANSRIRDTDMAKTMMEYTQGNTLTQAAQAMLAQANQAPSQVLQLLQ